jgi:transcription antitermination factor NusA-like protein
MKILRLNEFYLVRNTAVLELFLKRNYPNMVTKLLKLNFVEIDMDHI